MSSRRGSKSALGRIALQQRYVAQLPTAVAAGPSERPRSRPCMMAAQMAKMELTPEALAYAEAVGLPGLALDQLILSLGAMRVVPRELAEEMGMLVVDHAEAKAIVAVASPPPESALEELEFLLGKALALYAVEPALLQAAIAGAYDAAERGQRTYRPILELLQHAGATAAPRSPSVVPDLEPDLELMGADEVDPLGQGAPIDAGPLPPPPGIPEGVALPELRRSVNPTQPGLGVARLDAAFNSAVGGGEEDEALYGRRVLSLGLRPGMREVLDLRFQDRGPICEELEGGEALVREVLAEAPDLILLSLDRRPGVMPALEIIRCIREHPDNAQLPIIAFGGRDQTHWRVVADLHACFGIEHVLTVPEDEVRLGSTVAAVLMGQPVVPDHPSLPPAAAVALDTGMRAFERGDLALAISDLENGLEAAPNVFDLYYHLGLLRGRKGALFLAVTALEQAVRLQPRHFSALKNLAVVYQRAGFRHLATETWQRAMWNAPDAETRANIREHMAQLL